MDILEQTLETSQDEIQLKGEEIDDPKGIVHGTDLTIIEDEGSISDEQTVDNLAQAQAILDADEEVQYQWKSGDGVTYRVVHVNPEEQDGDPITPNYATTQGHLQPGATVVTGGITTNHFYVIGNANEVFNAQSPRSLAPRANVQIESRNICVTNKPTRVRRDERRRATHNEVERRRRDKINNWIAKLSKIIPDCSSMDNNKSVQSKGGILAKACEYIIELRRSDEQLAECLKEVERLNSHIEFLQQQNEKLKVHNALLRTELNQRGISLGSPSDLETRTGTSVADS
ncbi:UNVERIFIED_CONTAM: hypothetical protein PYX00_001851 [Menopon gallinae]|uniref:BHLH domain-containing protein n=1 Tax=Menopon gallinae TaxID=328185 RepID=A0AAW2IE30_9NEOP